jgi:OPT family small oligopeptide transporter
MPLGWLNPDRSFNIKEHALITIMANVSFGSAAATQIIEAMVKFYKMPSQGGFQVLLCITTQMFGFGVAGMVSRWLVEPANMIWPQVLSNAALLSTLHSKANQVADGWTITRLRFFLLVFICGAIWYLFPGYLFTALSFFNFVCWIAPSNVVLNQLFGHKTGLGMSMLTFDWSQVVFANQSPLLVPFWAGLNVMGSFALFFWLLVPLIYYTNTWHSAYLPLLDPNTFDNTGRRYDMRRVMNRNGTVNVEEYRSYSPMFISAGFAVTYGVAFANLTGIFVHTALYHGKELLEQWSGRNKKDVHARIMESYRPVPWWWFAGVTLLMFGLSIVTSEVWETGLPAWAVLLAFVLPIIYFIPVGIIKALTNITSNQLNLITEFIGGYAFLGKPVANMTFKFYGYVAVAQGLE